MLTNQALAALHAPRLTMAIARPAMAALGLSIRKTDENEFRVNFTHGAEATAAYESDLQAAIDTGLAMLAHRNRIAGQLELFGHAPRAAVVLAAELGA